MPRSLSAKRFWFIVAAVAVAFLVIGYQVVQLTVIRRSSLIDAAQRQHKLTVSIPPVRGTIVDRNGRELATNLKNPSLYASPRMLGAGERETLTALLQRTLGKSRAYLEDRLGRDKAFIWLKRQLSREEASKIESLNHPALGFVEEYRRFYPQGELLSQVLGFTNIDNKGLEGVELALNHELEGQAGKRYTKRDALGREIRAFDIKKVPAVNGNRVTLTIDQYIQYLTEKALEKAFVEWKAQGAMAVVMNPKTGEILAMTNRPSYDPNDASRADLASRRNRVVTDMFEPGSIFKIVAASAVLNERAAGPETIFFCEDGQYQYGSRTLRDVKPHGDLSLREVIIKSSNIGTVKMAALLEPETFQDYIRRFGFGQRTGIDYPGEAAGFTRPPAQWSSTSPYNIPMGHEIMVTTLQMARAFAVIANGGLLVRPYLVEHLEDEHGVVLRQNKPRVLRRVIDKDVARQMRGILTQVVDDGTGKRARIDGLAVAGKTGTAQKVLPDGGGYSHSSFISSFVGFAPADDPQLVMAVVLDDPKPKYYGGTVAAPVFKEVIEAALMYMRYVPEKPVSLNDASPAVATQENQPMLLPVSGPGRAV